MDDLAAMLHPCPVCGTMGRVVGSDEGTQHFEVAAAIAPRLTPDREALDNRAYRIVERAAHMGGCSQTHHEHLTADAKRVLVALDEAQRLAASPDAPRVAGLDVRTLDRVFDEMAQRGWLNLPDGHSARTVRGVFEEAYARFSDIGDTATPATSDEP